MASNMFYIDFFFSEPLKVLWKVLGDKKLSTSRVACLHNQYPAFQKYKIRLLSKNKWLCGSPIERDNVFLVCFY